MSEPFFHKGKLYYRDDPCSPIGNRLNEQGKIETVYDLPIDTDVCKSKGPALQEFSSDLPHSVEVTDGQRNLTIIFESKPRSSRERDASREIFSSDRSIVALFPNSYPKYFDWRRKEHLLFCNNMREALKNAYFETGDIIEWFRKNGRPLHFEYQRILANPSDNGYDSGFEHHFSDYCSDFATNLCLKIRSVTWLTTDKLEGPMALLDLASAHFVKGIFSIGSAVFTIAQETIITNGADIIKARLTPVFDKAVDKVGMKTANEAVSVLSGELASRGILYESATSIGGLATDKIVDQASEKVIEFSKSEIDILIKKYQRQHKRNPDLTVPDPISNPIFETILGAGATVFPALKPAKIGYDISKDLLNSIYHFMEAKELRKEAIEWTTKIIEADQRGLSHGVGHTFSDNRRKDIICKDIKHQCSSDSANYLRKLNVKFLDVNDRFLRLRINKIENPPEEEGLLDRWGRGLSEWWNGPSEEEEKKSIAEKIRKKYGTKLNPTQLAIDEGYWYRT